MTKLSPDEAAAVSSLQSRLDRSALEAIGMHETRPTMRKYLDVDKWFPVMWGHAREVGLVEGPPLRILDIGTGPGYFPYICRSLGHDCIGLDRPGFPFYERIRDLVETTVVYHRIEPFEPLPPFPQKFDLVTAFRCPFNTVWAERRLFTIEEWAFFVDDLRGNALSRGGSFFMKMNAKYDFDGPKLGDPALMALFSSRGGNLTERGQRIHFRSAQ
jgi:hypothetical protein